VSIAIARGWQSGASPSVEGWPQRAGRPILANMAILPPMVGPRAALKDLTAFMRQRSREQILGATMAVLVTLIIVIIFFVDSKINTAPPEQVIYVESYGPGRTDADIRRDQLKASEERRRAEEARRKEFQELEKKFGIE
jgi:hypothetical protein